MLKQKLYSFVRKVKYAVFTKKKLRKVAPSSHERSSMLLKVITLLHKQHEDVSITYIHFQLT